LVEGPLARFGAAVHSARRPDRPGPRCRRRRSARRPSLVGRGRDKPADLGTGVVCASFGPDGSWLSVGGLHPRVGFVELNGLPPFDDTLRGDPLTRAYRRLTDPPTRGCGSSPSVRRLMSRCRPTVPTSSPGTDLVSKRTTPSPSPSPGWDLAC
jgi:hypothetical protein